MLLEDRHGRVARDLRVSVTDRCNLRCSYCMPADAIAWTPRDELLTDAEIVRLVRIGVERLGITGVRFTGGEPLLRRSLESIVEQVAALRGPDGAPQLALTTNGIGLESRARDLRAAGIVRINVSLDTLDRERFARIARRDRLDDVLAGLEAAAAAGFDPIKINTVALRGENLAEAAALLGFSLDRGYEQRFIEHMPLGPRHTWDRAAVATQAEILAIVADSFTLTPRPGRGSAPAAVWDVAPGEHPGGTVGIIASVTAPFCAACDRTRLTGDGQLRSCLFSTTETDLRGLLRGGATDAEIATAWARAMWAKPRAHGIDDDDFAQPMRIMHAIGG